MKESKYYICILLALVFCACANDDNNSDEEHIPSANLELKGKNGNGINLYG